MSILSISTGAFCVRNCCLCVCVQMILLFCHSCCCRRRRRTEGKMFAICFAWKFKTYTIENRIADNPIIDATRAQPKPSIELNGFFCVHCEFFIVPSHEHTQIKLNSRHSFFWRFSHPAHTFAEKKFTTWSSKFDCAYDNVRSSFVDWMCFLWVLSVATICCSIFQAHSNTNRTFFGALFRHLKARRCEKTIQHRSSVTNFDFESTIIMSIVFYCCEKDRAGERVRVIEKASIYYKFDWHLICVLHFPIYA